LILQIIFKKEQNKLICRVNYINVIAMIILFFINKRARKNADFCRTCMFSWRCISPIYCRQRNGIISL